MPTLLATLFSITITVILFNLFLLLLPFSRAELPLWRRLGVQRLRRYVTKRRKTDQPLSARTVSIAKKNIVWHIIMTAVIFIIVAKYCGDSNPLAYALTGFCIFSSVAWLAGSIIQRQKLAIIHFSKPVA